MRTLILPFLLLFACPFKFCRNCNADDIIGRWRSLKGNVEVQVFKSGNEYKASVTWFDDKDDKSRPMNNRCDKWNPDPRLRSQKILGLEVMSGLKYNSTDEEWQDGSIYDARSGKYYNASAFIDSQGLLKVRGYWHIAWLGQTLSFKKIE